MTLRDIMILSFTFVVGVLSGMYFYYTAYLPNYVNENATYEANFSQEFSIIGVTYGGASTNYIHPSFRFDGDRQYDYFPGGTTQGETREGELPQGLVNAVRDALAVSDLQMLAEPIIDRNCASYTDDLDYEYNIEIDGVEYELDTCTTTFTNDTDLGQVLLRVWDYLEAPEQFDFSIRNMPETDGDTDGEWRGVRGYIEDKFRESGFDSTF